MARLRAALAALLTPSDPVALTAVVLVAALVRLAFLFRAPPFYVGGDSPTYLEPAVELLRGLGFDPIVKRPPGYPLFLAAAMAFLGQDLQGVNFLQHVLGVITVAATWAIGRLTFGRAAGLLAGLLVAFDGPLVIYEHYIMAETLFTCLLALAVLVTVAVARGGAPRLSLTAGLLFGLAAATRQSAQVLILLVPFALLLAGHGWRGALRASVLAAIGFLVVVLPWLAFDYARHRVLSSGTLGETLIWRLTRSGPEDEFFDWKLPPVEDRRLQEARKFVYGQAGDRELPSDTKVALQRRFGFSEGEADGLMRSIALEAIGHEPGRYLSSSLGLLRDHLLGEEQFLGGQGKQGGVTRYADVVSKYQDWWSDLTRPLIQNASPAQEAEFRRAQWLANLFQPYRYGTPLLALFVVGMLAAALTPSRRLGLIPSLAALGLLALAAFLAGALPRYRYPADPFLAVVEMGGLVTLISLARFLPRALARSRGTGTIADAGVVDARAALLGARASRPPRSSLE